MDFWKFLSAEFRRNFVIGADFVLIAAIVGLSYVIQHQNQELINCRRDVEAAEKRVGEEKERLLREHMNTLREINGQWTEIEKRLARAEQKNKR